MITRLYINNGFKHHDKTFTFKKGLTGIIGKNESGKSLVVEFIRYALFGSAALRGTGGDYKKLHVELDFEVAGTSYTVIRKGTQASLEGIASGTKPVNQAIRGILGYDLKVFDVANACNQGRVEALSDMTPNERKQMVDQTVGLTVLDEVIKFCGTEGNTRKREAEAFKGALVEPVRPEGEFPPVATIKDLLTVAEDNLAEFNQLKGFFASRPKEVKKPKKCSVKESLEELLAHQEKLEAVAIWKKQLAATKAPEFTQAQLDAFLEQNEAYERFLEKQRLLKQGHHECPKCKHQWPLAAEKLKEFDDVKDIEKPRLARGEIARHVGSLANQARIEDLTRRIADAGSLDDRSDDLVRWRSHNAAVAQYEAYISYNEGIAEKQVRFEDLTGVQEQVSELRQQFSDAKNYWTAIARFEQDQKNFEANTKAYEKMVLESDNFLNARTAIQNLKVEIKSFLLPSLNKVASHLLGQMTGGERSQIHVDDAFEIEVDGQRLGTLSGSGKAVANLAIRIALGQILTNRVFSLFLADEVDASMDDERATNTAEALRRLTETVSQVILVTHKIPETDHLIELTK